MRAAEFIKTLADVVAFLDGGETKSEAPPKNPKEKDPNPVFVPPLQQDIELKKASAGKESPIINKLTQDETEHNPDKPIFKHS